ncbi:GNAT family N-acetyltransferase [Hydromonas duriensis]|uniref:GNAT family N-acetyltransferase n=1 Tax=Hydromonas duriensis TaxID=1527608 RepID=UPI0013C30010|nr:GNAT family N-acyltransferase [Hydromonas duriensis]
MKTIQSNVDDSPAVTGRHGLAESVTVCWATTQAEVEEVQRLRYQVFADELGVHLSGHKGLDEDKFDPYAEHVYVRDNKTGQVVGTYRALTALGAAQCGWYSDQEFDIRDLLRDSEKMLEVGRACVHKDYRNGTVLMTLWKAILQFAAKNQFELILGCTSVPVASHTPAIADIHQMLIEIEAMSDEYAVSPRNPFTAQMQPEVEQGVKRILPPLFKGYLRLGAKVCGEPTYDPDFQTADYLTVLRLSSVSPRYVKHFDLS